MGALRTVGGVGWSSFAGIDREIAAAGYPVSVTCVHPTAGIERRAKQLKVWILENCKIPRGKKIILVTHSMGGLDARYMLSRLNMASKVDALITVCTPHRGTPYADWCIKHLGRRLRGIQLMNFLGLDMQGVMDLTTEHCARFNEQVLDVPGVRYYSVAGQRPLREMPPMGYHSWKIVHKVEGENDGLVSPSSGRWGKYLGTWRADHWRVVNRRFIPDVGNRTEEIGAYYLSVLDRAVADGAVANRAAIPA